MTRSVIVRCCAMLLALAAVWTGLDLAREPYRETVRFRHAEACPRGAKTSECIGPETGRVVDKNRSVDSDGDADYSVSVERASGGTEAYDVSHELYTAAERGSPAHLKIWHGEVVGITVGGTSDDLDPSSVGSLLAALLVVWAGAGLVSWSLLGGGRFRVLFGWMGMRAFAWMLLGCVTLASACEIAADGTRGWGPVGWAAISLFALVVCVPLMWFAGLGEFDRPGWYRGGPRRRRRG